MIMESFLGEQRSGVAALVLRAVYADFCVELVRFVSLVFRRLFMSFRTKFRDSNGKFCQAKSRDCISTSCIEVTVAESCNSHLVVGFFTQNVALSG